MSAPLTEAEGISLFTFRHLSRKHLSANMRDWYNFMAFAMALWSVGQCRTPNRSPLW